MRYVKKKCKKVIELVELIMVISSSSQMTWSVYFSKYDRYKQGFA